MLILTPNRRLAIYLYKQKIKAPIFPFQAWVEHLWKSLVEQQILPNSPISMIGSQANMKQPQICREDASGLSGEQIQLTQDQPLPQLLTPYEEELIWGNIIKSSSIGETLIRSHTLSRLVRNANELSRTWQIPVNESFAETEDSLAFFQWWQEYNQVLKQKNWIDSTQLLEILPQYFTQCRKFLPKQIECIGFSEWTPAQTQFLEALTQAGIKITYSKKSCSPKSVLRIPLSSQEEEILQAAQAAKHWLKENPLASIGIVVLDLEQRREEIESTLQDILPAHSFNVAAPIAVSEHSIIAAALLSLSLIAHQIPLETLSRFLRSPFFKDGIDEQDLRAALDVRLYELKQPSYSLEEVIFIYKTLLDSQLGLETKSGLESQSFVNDSSLLTVLKAVQALKPNFKGKKSSLEWIEAINALLETLGWGQGRDLNPAEIAVKEEVQTLLLAYQGIEKIIGPHSFKQAIHHLEALAQKSTFLPPGENLNPSVHVLGLLEAIGIPFDYLWVLGLHQEVWPKASSPNPFIPLRIQMALNLPRSNAQRELMVAREFTEQLCQGAKETVIFSYPLMHDNYPMQASPLIRNLPQTTMQSLGIESATTIDLIQRNYQGAVIPAKAEIEKDAVIPANASIHKDAVMPVKVGIHIDPVSPANEGIQKCEHLTPLQPEDSISPIPSIPIPPIQEIKVPPRNPLKGSVRALTLQAQCPFKAFAEIRLRAESIMKPPRGLTKIERGEIIHEILYLFWKEIKTQARLKALTHEALKQCLTMHTDVVINRWEQRYSKRLKPRYMKLERARTTELLLDFMALEVTREPFEVIALETQKTVSLESLEYKIRIDRIDRLESGASIIIDYKTGQINTHHWFKEPLEEPQLPLYYMSQQSAPIAVLLSILRRNELKYQGISNENAGVPGLKAMDAEAFLNLSTLWRKNLASLAQHFEEGVVTVNPLHGEQTCRTCKFLGLCRKTSESPNLSQPLSL